MKDNAKIWFTIQNGQRDEDYDFGCAVVHVKDTTEWLKVGTGVKKYFNVSGLLFLLVVDWVMRKTLQESNTRMR